MSYKWREMYMNRLVIACNFDLENVGKGTEYVFRESSIRWQMSKSANGIFDIFMHSSFFSDEIFDLEK